MKMSMQTKVSMFHAIDDDDDNDGSGGGQYLLKYQYKTFSMMTNDNFDRRKYINEKHNEIIIK